MKLQELNEQELKVLIDIGAREDAWNDTDNGTPYELHPIEEAAVRGYRRGLQEVKHSLAMQAINYKGINDPIDKWINIKLKAEK